MFHGTHIEAGMHTHVCLERWIATAGGGQRNVGQWTEGYVVEVWHKPHPTEPHRCSGRNYVRLADGRTLFRADCYDPRSPYDWQVAGVDD